MAAPNHGLTESARAAAPPGAVGALRRRASSSPPDPVRYRPQWTVGAGKQRVGIDVASGHAHEVTQVAASFSSGSPLPNRLQVRATTGKAKRQAQVTHRDLEQAALQLIRNGQSLQPFGHPPACGQGTAATPGAPAGRVFAQKAGTARESGLCVQASWLCNRFRPLHAGLALPVAVAATHIGRQGNVEVAGCLGGCDPAHSRLPVCRAIEGSHASPSPPMSTRSRVWPDEVMQRGRLGLKCR